MLQKRPWETQNINKTTKFQGKKKNSLTQVAQWLVCQKVGSSNPSESLQFQIFLFSFSSFFSLAKS